MEVWGGEISIATTLGVVAASAICGRARMTGISRMDMLGEGALGDAVSVRELKGDTGVLSAKRVTRAGAGVARSGAG